MARKESADTQEYLSCQFNEMDVDTDENKEGLSFIPSAVSSSAGWRQAVLQYFDIASVRVVTEPYTIHLREMLQSEARQNEGADGKRQAVEGVSSLRRDREASWQLALTHTVFELKIMGIYVKRGVPRSNCRRKPWLR